MKAYIIDRERVFETLTLLENYSDKNKAVTEGLRKASRILSIAGKQSLLQSNKKRTGNLYRSISYIIKRRKAGSITGFKRNGNTTSSKGNHAHLVDKGTKERLTEKGYNRGKHVGSKFWEKAVNSKEHEVFNTLYDSIETSVLKLIRRQ